jgi:protease I
LVTVAGLAAGEARGALGMRAKPDMLLGEAKSGDFDVIILPGGGGSRKYLFNNAQVHELVRAFNEENKIVASICLSGAVLANAGILDGKKATVFATPETVGIYEKNNVNYMGDGVFRDGNIVTASGPEYAQKFAEKILEALRKKI